MSADSATLEAGSLAARWGAIRNRLTSGDLGSLPVIAGLALIWIVFQSQNQNFLTARNLTNLVLQIVVVGLLAVGIVMVLLLGEIDLSVGALSGLGAAVMAVLNVKHGVPAPIAIAGGVATGTAIGLFQGFWFTRLGIPSFVVTLAGLLAWQGALLQVLGLTGTVNVLDPSIDSLAGTYLPVAAGWVLAAIVVVVYAGSRFLQIRRRRAAGLPVGSLYQVAGSIVLAAGAVLITAWVMNSWLGVPVALLILLGFVVFFDVITRRTRFGRSIFAVGGNAEAARRVGFSVNGVRIAVFALSGTLAACGGIMGASRLLAVNQSSGGSDLLLDAIAAAVIGGTSLFGGRGTVWSAITGALVIGSISNGMDLLALASSTKLLVTGAVLLAAVTLDAVARRGRAATGRG